LQGLLGGEARGRELDRHGRFRDASFLGDEEGTATIEPGAGLHNSALLAYDTPGQLAAVSWRGRTGYGYAHRREGVQCSVTATSVA
jgi:hypothetical protein